MLLLEDDVVGREIDLGEVTVTAEAIEGYLRWAGDDLRLSRLADSPGPIDSPATFCLSLYSGMTPAVELPDDCFAMYGGHDIEVRRPIRAGDTLRVHARITDVYEKSGRSGALTVVVREITIRDPGGREVVRVSERQMVRRRRDAARANE